MITLGHTSFTKRCLRAWGMVIEGHLGEVILRILATFEFGKVERLKDVLLFQFFATFDLFIQTT